MLSLNL